MITYQGKAKAVKYEAITIYTVEDKAKTKKETSRYKKNTTQFNNKSKLKT